MNADQKPTTYKDAGVDIDAADALIDAIRPLVAKTVRTGVMGGIGGFGGIFDPKAAGFDDPLLISSTDGVGTKLKIAIETGRLDSIGIDLVAMCVNDIVVQGAEPLYFLDYFATGKLDVAAAEQVIRGVAAGCEQAGCALTGGETAEMPGLYGAGDFDLAGFAVGAVERDALITGSEIEAGDILLGLAASGFHSNGYSLLRKLVSDAGLSYSDELPGLAGETIGECLLKPTRIYVKSLLSAFKETEIQGLAHITGGGLLENIPRILPDGLAAVIDAGSWPLPAEQDWARAAAKLPPGELARTFNCGIGMIVVVRAAEADAVAGFLERSGETVYSIGRIESAGDARRVILSGPAGSWGEAADWTIPSDGRGTE